jgi:uncharacterized delta-60 repeat protein
MREAGSYRVGAARVESLESRTLLTGAGDIVTAFGGGDGATSFTKSGVVFTMYNMAVQSDGKIVEVGGDTDGYADIVRYNIDGTPDTTFGSDKTGLVRFHFRPDIVADRATAVAIQVNGDMVIAGDNDYQQGFPSYSYMSAARFFANGQRDASFYPDDGHQRLIDNTSASAIVIQNGGDQDESNDLFVIVGTEKTIYADDNADMIVMRLMNPNGKIGGVDPSFGGGAGYEAIGFGADETGYAAALDLSSGSRFQDIVIAGFSDNGTKQQFAVARLKAGDGSPDTSFSGDGKVTSSFVSEDSFAEAHAVLVQSDGKIVVAGEFGPSSSKGPYQVGLFRLKTDGSGDSTFGVSNGQIALNLGGSKSSPIGMIRSQNGDLLVDTMASDGIHIAAMTPNGQLDTVFSGDGLQTIGALSTDTLTPCIALEPGGYLMVGGGKFFYTVKLYDRALATIYIGSNDLTGSETGPDTASFFIARRENIGQGTRVYFTTGGTASPPGTIPISSVDYSGISSSVLTRYVDVPSGGTSTTTTITPINDSGAERDETAIFSLVENPQFYDIVLPTSVTLTILDNDGRRVSGMVYKDANGNGGKDSGEGGLAGVQVYLDANNNKALDSGEATATTDANGNYQFFSVPVGSYMLRQTVPTGYAQSDPANNGGVSITVVSGASVTGKNLGDKPSGSPPPGGSISGTVFNDANSNGAKDSGETGIPGVTLYNDANNNSKPDTGEATTSTDSSGNYKFAGLSAGSYKIRQILPSGDTQISPANNFGQTVTLATNQVVTGKNFADHGSAAQTGSISGITFNDVNKSGTLDAGETKASGKTVFLDTNNNGALDSGEKSVVTDANGNWSFGGLVAGTYHVRRVFPTGYTYSTPLIDVILGAGQNDSGLLIGSKAT